MSLHRAGAVALAALGIFAFAAASPAPKPTLLRINVEKMQPKTLLPKVPLHTSYIVQTNKLGQVTRVVTGTLSKSPTFNAQTYGNANQAYIRTDQNHAIPGTYKLIYDFNPKTARVRRDVQLMKAGGVNVNAIGAATRLEEIARKQKPLPTPAAAAPRPLATIRPGSLPDLPQVMGSPR